MSDGDRVIVGCTHGEEDPDRVVCAYLTAGAALDQGRDVVMWLTVEGVRLAVAGVNEPRVLRLHDAVEGVEVGDRVDRRLEDRRDERAANAQIGRVGFHGSVLWVGTPPVL